MPTLHSGDPILRVLLVIVAVVILAPLVLMLFSVPMMGMMGWWWGGGGSGMSPFWGFLMPLVLLLVLVAIGYLAFRAIAGTDGVGGDPAMAELRLAYARGELSDEEYEERRERLTRERE